MNWKEQVRAIADPLVAKGATPDQINDRLRLALGIEIGQGGSGPDETIPPCPYCGAHGGGGHGVFCPLGA